MTKKYGCSGHIDTSRIEGFSEESVRKNLRDLFSACGDARLYCGMADGADKIFFDEAVGRGIPVVAVLPKPAEEYAEEHADKGAFFADLRLAEEVVTCDGSCETTDYILSRCQELLVLWDGKKLPFVDENGAPVHLGGTYYAIVNAEKKGLPIRFF